MVGAALHCGFAGIRGVRSWPGHVRPRHSLHPPARGAQAGQHRRGERHLQERGGRRCGLDSHDVRGLRRHHLRQRGRGARAGRLRYRRGAHGRRRPRAGHAQGGAHGGRGGHGGGAAAPGPGRDAAARCVACERLGERRLRHDHDQGRDPGQPSGGDGELECGWHGRVGGALAEQRHAGGRCLGHGEPDAGRWAARRVALGRPRAHGRRGGARCGGERASADRRALCDNHDSSLCGQ
mmetsp:Transcript_3462/g.12054  ORF Transcript_3462/g.12054 Transcript_3462/m.12054 type:complete len:237 (-) Transcript_3462:135-845(-)